MIASFRFNFCFLLEVNLIPHHKAVDWEKPSQESRWKCRRGANLGCTHALDDLMVRVSHIITWNMLWLAELGSNNKYNRPEEMQKKQFFFVRVPDKENQLLQRETKRKKNHVLTLFKEQPISHHILVMSRYELTTYTTASHHIQSLWAPSYHTSIYFCCNMAVLLLWLSPTLAAQLDPLTPPPPLLRHLSINRFISCHPHSSHTWEWNWKS